MKKRFIPLLLAVVLVSFLLFWFLGRGVAKSTKIKGLVEGTTYSQIIEVTGKIIEFNLELGSFVNEGDVLARLDDRDLLFSLEQLQITREKKQLSLALLKKGASEEDLEKAKSDIDINEAQFRSAEATYEQAQIDVVKYEELWKSGGVSKNEYDRARLYESIAKETLESATGLVHKAKEQYSQLNRGAERENIALAEADIRDIDSKIKQMQENHKKFEIRAVCDGRVIGLNYFLGSMVNAGYNLADISNDNEKYVVCYLPVKLAQNVKYGDSQRVVFEDKEYQAKIRFIDIKSQYTPKDMQTTALKNKASIKIKLLLPTETTLKPSDVVLVHFLIDR